MRRMGLEYFTCIYHVFKPNVDTYSIHGASGYANIIEGNRRANDRNQLDMVNRHIQRDNGNNIPRITDMTMEKQEFEDVSLIEN